MKPLALFGIPHNALVYVFVSYIHVCIYAYVSVSFQLRISERRSQKKLMDESYCKNLLILPVH